MGHGRVWRTRAVLCALTGAIGIAAAMGLGGSAAVGAPTCTLNFTNTAGGDWFTAANWSDAVTPATHRAPIATDVACVPNTVTGLVTFSTGSSSSVQTLLVKGSAGFKVS